ncbi:MAG TPA: zinc ribbon domain-containing protein [Methylomusa anaerophila]|jgi:membrane protease subunit (stomatin/prohibitin family)|uniref:zinc ribbon domain-containing protein n=2 Tax=Bacillota TaxID=1239 RepID=UPI000483184C|nr:MULTISPECIES: zinc ribbon domain-containing protein [Bacillota]HML89976.1 zinc ribbon domain-containing protein [Methylomusa anaerophila]
MSFFSKSSKGNHYRQGNYGSNHYQKKGIFGNLLNMFGSGSGSGGHYNNYGNQPYPPQQGYPQGQQNPSSVQQNTLACNKCNSRVPAGSKFCLNCGEQVKTELYCQNCGGKMPPNAKFCNNCGNKLNG